MRLYDIEEAAGLLRMASVTLRRLVKRKRIHFRRIGGRLMFTDEDIQGFVTASRDIPWGRS